LSTNVSPLAPTPVNEDSQLIPPFGSVSRRFAAYIVDSIVLSIVGIGIGIVFFDKLWELGLWGRLVGFFAGSIYFASLECGIGKGQSLGKRWMKLRVVDVQGNCISFARSLSRFTIFAIPSLLYGLRIPDTRTPWIVSSFIFLVIVWLGGSTLYLICFNDQSRQGVHDLAVGSFVVYYDHSGPVNAKPIPRLHVHILIAMLAIITASAAGLKDWSDKLPSNSEFRRDAIPIEAMDGVQRARLAESLKHGSTGGPPKKILYARIIRASRPESEDAFAGEVARIILQEDRNAVDYDQLSIGLFYGYDIGIATRWNHKEFLHTPAEWRQLVPRNLAEHP
jgi:uncharacterized RDD family membrane protein YckC